MSSKYIALFIVISLIISAVYFIGYKKNVRLMKELSVALEKAFNPNDKLYTYLGGVLGFSVEYQVKGFKKIMANLRLIPRQSALYLPFMFLTSGKDNLQILFYVNKPLRCELHLIKKSPLNLTKPKIYNKNNLKSTSIEIHNTKFEMLYEHENYDKRFLKFVELFPLRYFNHLAITTENDIVYIQLLFYGINPELLIETLLKAKTFLKQFYS